MKESECNFCSHEGFEESRIEYLYRLKGKYLLVPNTPVLRCSHCGMMYYDGVVLKEIERTFFAIHDRTEEADSYVQVPVIDYTAIEKKSNEVNLRDEELKIAS